MLYVLNKKVYIGSNICEILTELVIYIYIYIYIYISVLREVLMFLPF